MMLAELAFVLAALGAVFNEAFLCSLRSVFLGCLGVALDDFTGPSVLW